MRSAPIDLKAWLDRLYAAYHRRELVHPDPLSFLYRYPDAADREVVGLIAATFAYGRVAYILKSIEVVLDQLGPSPARELEKVDRREWGKRLHGFQHRWTKADQVVDLLVAMRDVRRTHGSLEAAFVKGLRRDDRNVQRALGAWTSLLRTAGNMTSRCLVADATKGSACKRLHLYLRWMVRSDAIDPGGWRDVAPSQLIIPLDVHLHGVARMLKLTRRKPADLRTAMEITDNLRKICPDDPVRYDFALTRPGIREGMSPDELRGILRASSSATVTRHDA